MPTDLPLDDLVPVILAGGSGTRLWPASRTELPKHLAPLLGGNSLLQATALRLLDLAPAERVWTVGATAQETLLRRQLAELDPGLERNLLLEPSARNTAAAIALAAHAVAACHGGDCVLFVCPSDHLVRRPEVLRAAVQASLAAVRDGELATFGIAPERPETGFGYIQLGPVLDEGNHLHRVASFVEKPPLDRARAMLEAGGHFWNSGMFLFRADRILEELASFEPEIAARVAEAWAAMSRAASRTAPPTLYARVPAQPIDKAVMERSDRVVVVPCDPGWSDLGSWHALWELSDRDAAGNATIGDVVLEDTRDSLVRAEQRLVAVAGLRDITVVETADAVLVAHRHASDAIRRVVARLGAARRPEAHHHLRRAYAWGSHAVLAATETSLVHELVLDPGAEPEQGALPAADLWIVLAGEAVLEESEARYRPGEVISAAAAGRIRNAGRAPVHLLGIELAPPGPAADHQEAGSTAHTAPNPSPASMAPTNAKAR